jgi:hypothetical protein
MEYKGLILIDKPRVATGISRLRHDSFKVAARQF